MYKYFQYKFSIYALLQQNVASGCLIYIVLIY